MPVLLQHFLAIAAVLGCASFLARRGWKSVTGKGCSSGCGGCGHKKKPAAAGPHVAFIPVEMLARKK